MQVLGRADTEGLFRQLVQGLIDASNTAEFITNRYGSETDNSEEQEKNLSLDVVARSLKGQAMALDVFIFEDQPTQQILVLVASARGLGEFPRKSKQTFRRDRGQASETGQTSREACRIAREEAHRTAGTIGASRCFCYDSPERIVWR